MASAHAKKTGNPLFDHPGWSATLFAVITLGAFLFLLYGAATDHSAHPKGAGGHGAGHGAGAAAPAGQH